MRTAVLGTQAHLNVRADVLERESEFQGTYEFERDIDLVCIGVPASGRADAAADALRRGANVLLEWPPTLSIDDCQRIVRLAEEAGREVAVSRPLRWGLPPMSTSFRAEVVGLESRGSSSWSDALADVVDLALTLARGSSVRRVDAEAARGPRRAIITALVHMRFHNGMLAQAAVRPSAEARRIVVHAAGTGAALDRTLTFEADQLRAETADVLKALAENRRPRVTALDALATLRVVERVMAVLR